MSTRIAWGNKSLKLGKLDIEEATAEALVSGRHTVERWAEQVKSVGGRFVDENLATLRAIWKSAPEVRTVAGLEQAGRGTKCVECGSTFYGAECRKCHGC